jgi:hypothetical protein
MARVTWRAVNKNKLPKVLKDFYTNNGEFDVVTCVGEKNEGYKVDFGSAYDTWSKVNGEWNWEVGYK